MPRDGSRSVTVPGAVAGWEALQGQASARSRSRSCSRPRSTTPSEGFPVGEITAEAWAAASGRGWATPSAARTYLPGGRPPAPGELFKNPDLARSLPRIAERGRDGFYKGETADAIVSDCSRGRRHDDRRRPRRATARVGRADLDAVSRLDGLGAAAEHAGHRGADDARTHGAPSRSASTASISRGRSTR